MYYEEKVINGYLCHRSIPNGKWMKFRKRELLDRIEDLCLKALVQDAGHHKQWYIERILENLGYNEEELLNVGLQWERGIAP